MRQPPGGGARARPGTRPRLPGAGPARSAPRPRRSGPAAPSGQSRTPFIFLLVGLLGGGLICLLVINTVLAAGSYQITNLQKINETQLEQVQTLRQQVASNRSPGTIAREARNLGMIQPPLIKFLDLRTGRIISQPATEQGFPIVGGYAP